MRWPSRATALAALVAGACTLGAWSAQARPATATIAQYASFVRLPVPAGVTLEVERHDALSSRQTVKFSRKLSEDERAAINDVASLTQHVRNLRWLTADRFEVQYRQPMADVSPISDRVWGLVVHRPDRLAASYVMGEERCARAFDHVTSSELMDYIEGVCRQGDVALVEGVRGFFTPEDEYIYNLVSLQQREKFWVEPERFSRWVWHEENVRPADRGSALILLAVLQVSSAQEREALQTLDKVAEIEHVPESYVELAAELSRGIFERVLESGVYAGEDVRAFYRERQSLDHEGVDVEVRLSLAANFEANGEHQDAVVQYQRLMEQGLYQDERVLTRLAKVYEMLGQTYRAHATLGYLEETQRKKR